MEMQAQIQEEVEIEDINRHGVIHNTMQAEPGGGFTPTPSERDQVQMNILGPPVDNEARGMIGELVSMGNPFKICMDHNTNTEPDSAKEDDQLCDRADSPPTEYDDYVWESYEPPSKLFARAPRQRQVEIAYPSPVRASVYTEERRDRSDSSWHASFEKLKEFWRIYGADEMPTKKDRPKLYQWCMSQRCAYRNELSLKKGRGLVCGLNRISEDKIETLEAAGFDFHAGPGSGNT